MATGAPPQGNGRIGPAASRRKGEGNLRLPAAIGFLRAGRWGVRPPGSSRESETLISIGPGGRARSPCGLLALLLLWSRDGSDAHLLRQHVQTQDVHAPRGKDTSEGEPGAEHAAVPAEPLPP